MNLQFMGMGAVETFRGRIYGHAEAVEDERHAFVKALATTGVLDCPAYDGWVRALQMAGWLPSEPEYEPAEGGGQHARWRLTPFGMEASR